MLTPPGIDRRTFLRIAGAYRTTWPVDLYVIDAQGHVAMSDETSEPADDLPWAHVRQFALSEVLRWGEPTVSYGPEEQLVWGVPLMHNMRLLGGVMAQLCESAVIQDHAAQPTMDLRRACADLRELVEQENLTNAALLESRRHFYQREKQRAEAIHLFKAQNHFSLRELYQQNEPELLSAVRRGDRGSARAVLNQMLVAMIQHAGGRFELVKSLFMELVVTVCRNAIEVGADPEAIWGADFANIAGLAQIESPEALAPWLHEMLERVLDAIYQHRGQTSQLLVTTAMQYMARHLGDQSLSRDRVAEASHLSPSHFSRLFREQAGRTFSDALSQLRINRASELLAMTDRNISEIAVDCGFPDQSYFSKVFRQQRGMTPRQYRRQVRQLA
jgi:AraC-like DNA-binding protein